MFLYLLFVCFGQSSAMTGPQHKKEKFIEFTLSPDGHSGSSGLIVKTRLVMRKMIQRQIQMTQQSPLEVGLVDILLFLKEIGV